jgi:hypothetical protein
MVGWFRKGRMCWLKGPSGGLNGPSGWVEHTAAPTPQVLLILQNPATLLSPEVLIGFGRIVAPETY